MAGAQPQDGPRAGTLAERVEEQLRRLIDRAGRWLLNNRPQPLAVGAEIEELLPLAKRAGARGFPIPQHWRIFYATIRPTRNCIASLNKPAGSKKWVVVEHSTGTSPSGVIITPPLSKS